MPNLRFSNLLVVFLVVSFVQLSSLVCLADVNVASPVDLTAGPFYENIYVSTNGDDVSGSGSPQNPFATIQKAVDVAADGDVVIIADGTYTGEGNINIIISDKIITIRSESGNPADCIIDAENNENTSGFFIYRKYEICEVTIEGITLRNGDGQYPGSAHAPSAVVAVSCDVILKNLHIEQFSSHGITGQNIDCQIEGCVVTNCTGYGIYGDLCDMVVTNSCISNNEQGGIFIYDERLYLTNTLVTGNKGCGLKIYPSTFVSIEHSTLTDNQGNVWLYSEYSGSRQLEIKNSILWSDMPYEIYVEAVWTAKIDVGYSTIHGGQNGITPTELYTPLPPENPDYPPQIALTWQNNIDADPRFVDAAAGDYHLADTSPAIGAGVVSDVTTDFDGMVRGTPPDMGAYENVLDAPLRTLYVANTGDDETGNGSVANPYRTIQKAVDEAADDDIVLIADGIYTGAGNTNVVIGGPLHGSPSVIKSIHGPESCIIDCEYNENTSGLNICTDMTIEGLQIIHGTSHFINDDELPGWVTHVRPASGIYCNNANVNINNVIVSQCLGDGIIEEQCLLTVTNSRITDCGGSGLYGDYDDIEIVNCIISRNASHGIRAYGHHLTVTNTIISNNGECGIFRKDTIVTINHSTLAMNNMGSVSVNDDYDFTISNSIMWSNADYEIIGDYGITTLNIDHSLIRNGQAGVMPPQYPEPWTWFTFNWLDGNIDGEPVFANSAEGDYHLSMFSPCIGAGVVSAVTTDIDGMIRGTPPDMGAYESVLDAPLKSTLSVADAALNGYINGYVYTWNGQQYRPVSVFDTDIEIQPWQGFWTVLGNNGLINGIDLCIKKSDIHPAQVPDMTFMPGERYLFATPLQTAQTDLNTSSLGQQLGDGQYEKTWRIGRWLWDSESYYNYNGPDPQYDECMSLLPGKGFWLQQITSNPITIDLEGTKVEPEGDFFEIHLPQIGGDMPYTFHMTGNPYWYPMKWSDCMVKLSAAQRNSAAKTAVAPEDFASWHVGLSLIATDGSALDTYNRAGVMITGNDTMLDAFEMAPIGDFVQLVFIGSDNELTYDYRPSGLDEYSWNIELRTSYSSKEATLSFDNLLDIPDGYTITLTNDDTGVSFIISDTQNIPVILSAGAPVNYTLTAVKQPLAVDGNVVPETFAIIGNMPNPFNPTTTITYSLDRSGQTRLVIYNISGQVVETLVDGFMDAGIHDVQWHAAGAASGIYVARIVNNGRMATQKMMLVK